MIIASHGQLKDEHGRTLLLRGANLSGSSKIPFTPNGATHRTEGFFDHRQVSFVGRPFPLEEADEHFTRLKAWGLTFLRLLVTWEAVEHAGPGLYDQDYLDYLYAVVRKAGEHGFSLFIDPHQDVWSRFSGGDGAPGWTFEAAGLDITAFAATGAALTHQAHGGPLPRMAWPTNAQKLAAATMFTLFFAGSDFAPRLRLDGVPIQDYLQSHYIAAMQQVARRLHGLQNVVGYDSLNEPEAGYIGCPDLAAHLGELQLGESPTPFQSFLLGAGLPQVVDVFEIGFTGIKKTGTRLIDPGGRSAWLPGRECLWREHGVWDLDSRGVPHLLRPDYFAGIGNPIVGTPAADFYAQSLRPFINRFASAIRQVDPQALIFVEGRSSLHPPAWTAQDAPNIVFAPHWYDGLLLVFKDLYPWLGYDVLQHRFVLSPWAVRRSFARQLRQFRQHARQHMGNPPVLVGEIGTAFDLGERPWSPQPWSSLGTSGTIDLQSRAIERSMRALDDALLSFTLWNYTPDNTNLHGDQWNGEDFSIFSRDQQSDPADIHSGGRALRSVVRPYARKTAGEPLRMSFDIRSRRFELVFRHDPAVTAPTELFVPAYQYPQGFTVQVSDGTYQLDREQQVLLYTHTPARPEHWVRLKPKN